MYTILVPHLDGGFLGAVDLAGHEAIADGVNALVSEARHLHVTPHLCSAKHHTREECDRSSTFDNVQNACM
jgi:hypothetical protein